MISIIARKFIGFVGPQNPNQLVDGTGSRIQASRDKAKRFDSSAFLIHFLREPLVMATLMIVSNSDYGDENLDAFSVKVSFV